ncbi:uncharacterized protein LOC112047976 [Bicyclus anynana]|uniref:Uncharacterized protein LOC112047976 n=1 Tax=Bicyclus anynana TaxID=110368 RepID=A0A6J1N7I0_BICAN|nr:uncharacterized protein LOC112047976 [Bicyclus anynana]
MQGTQTLGLGARLRAGCLAIGYLHLIASLVDIGCHVVILFLITNGFQCDISKASIRAVQWNWLEPTLAFVNLGTHGFFPYPLTFHYYNAIPLDYLPIAEDNPKCYPGMLHLFVLDIFNFLSNALWLKFVLAFVSGVHKRDAEPVRMFYILCIMKLAIQLLAIGLQWDYERTFAACAFQFMDVCIATMFLVIINRYSTFLRLVKASKNGDQPPSYIECLINTPSTLVDEKKDIVFVIEEKKMETKEETQQS